MAADLVGGHADGQAVALAGLAQLDGPITEDGQLRAAKPVLAHDPVDHHPLGVLGDVADGAVDTAAEEVGVAQRLGLGDNVGVVGATGEVERDTAVAQRLGERDRALDREVGDIEPAVPEPGDALVDHLHQGLVVDALVAERVEDLLGRDDPELADHLDQGLHLHDGLDAGRLVDVVEDAAADLVIERLVGGVVCVTQNGLDHDGRHDLLPALAQRTDGPIVVEDGVLNMAERGRRIAQLDLGAGDIVGLATVLGQLGPVDVISVGADGENLRPAGRAGLVELLHGDGRSEVGELSRLGRRHAGPQAQGQCTGHGVAGADGVELLEQLDTGHLVNALGIHGQKPTRAARQEHRLVELPIELPCVLLGVVGRQDVVEAHLDTIELGRLAVVGLARDVMELPAVMARVEQHDLVGKLTEQCVGPVDEALVGDAARDLLIDDQRVGRLQRVTDAGQQRAIGRLAAPVEEPEVDARQLLAFEIGLAERHRVEVLVLDHEVSGIDAQVVELPSQFSAEDVVADGADDGDGLGLERGEIGHDVRGPAERVVVLGDGLGLEARLDGDLRARRVQDPVGIHTEIAVHGHGDILDPRQNLADALLVHAASFVYKALMISSYRNGKVCLWSPRT